MMTKLPAIFSIAVLVLGIMAAPSFAGTDEDTTPHLKVEDANTEQTSTTAVGGQQINMKVQMDDDVTGVAGLQFDLVLPTGLCDDALTITDDPGNNWDAAVSQFDSATNTISVAYAKAEQVDGVFQTNDGPMDIILVDCNVNSLADGTVVAVQLENVLLGDASEQEIPVTPVDLTVTVEQIQKGDVNDDSEINIFDMIRTGQIIVGSRTPTNVESAAADVSPAAGTEGAIGDTCGGGTINITDMIVIGQAIVSPDDPITFMNARC